MAFALALPLPRGKHTHVRDLVYASGSNKSGDNDEVARGMQAANNDAESNASSEEREMFVKLNLENGLCLKRTYTVKDQLS